MSNPQIFGVANRARSLAVTAQYRANVFYDFPIAGAQDRDGPNARAPVSIFGRPGLRLFGNYGADPVRGWRVVLPWLYVVMGNTFYRIANNTVAAVIGVIGSNSGPIYMRDNGTQLMIVDPQTGQGWNWQIFGVSAATGQAQDTFALIADPDFGLGFGATHVGYLNNFFVIGVRGANPLTTQVFQISDVGDCTGWNAAQFDLADSDSDALIAVAGYQNIMRLFGTRTTESWSDVGAAPFPFNRMPATSMGYGCAAVNSIAEFGDMGLAMLAAGRYGSPIPVLLMPEGYRPIGDDNLIANLEGYATVADAIGASYMIQGRRFYQLNFKSAGHTWVWDSESQVWCEYTSFLNGVETNFVGGLSEQFFGQTIMADINDGHIYILDSDTYTDADRPIIHHLISQHLFQSDKQQVLNSVQFDMEEGDGLPLGQGSNPLIVLRVSRDKGRTWSTPMTAQIGAQGLYQTRAIFRRLGRARDLTLWLMHSDPTKFVLTGEAADVGMMPT